MFETIALPARPRANVDAIIGEARARQRRRRTRLARTVILVVALAAVAFGASRQWGAPLVSWRGTSGDAAIERDVTATVRAFDNAVASGNYRAACSLLGGPGQGVLSGATAQLGVTGSCEVRLRFVARLAGKRRLDDLRRARISTIQHAGVRDNFAAQVLFNDADTSWAGYIPAVGLGRAGKDARVLIQCPPLICGGPHVLQNYAEFNKATKPAG